MTGPRDRGSVTVIVVVLMPVLVLFSAFVFDGGRGLIARRETQNAADAGALAKATDCARRVESTNFTPYLTTDVRLANSPECDAASSSTTVSMQRTITKFFSPGGGEATVTRSATASWGTVSEAKVIPLIIPDCVFSQATLDDPTDYYLYLDDAKKQTGCSSLAGGFSKLDNDKCAVTLTAGTTAPATVDGVTGNALNKIVPCITKATEPALPKDVIIAIYDSVACADLCTGKGPYPVTGFAMFRVTGYSFNGSNFGGTGMTKTCPNDKTLGRNCLRGTFRRAVISIGPTGPSTNYGLVKPYLTD